jgi:hypothetical protein
MAGTRELVSGWPPRRRGHYLYDKNVVDPAAIRNVMARAAPRIRPGGAETGDARLSHTVEEFRDRPLDHRNLDHARQRCVSQPGWLEGILKPFAEIMAVGGFTVLGYDDLCRKPWR